MHGGGIPPPALKAALLLLLLLQGEVYPPRPKAALGEKHKNRLPYISASPPTRPYQTPPNDPEWRHGLHGPY
jgi:hypothetical protein